MTHAWKATIAVLGCAASLGFASAVTAEPRTAQAAEPQMHMGAQPGKGDPLAMLKKVLDLTPEQQVQAQAILDKTHSQMKEMEGDDSLTSEDRMAKKQQLHEQAMEQLNEILTPEQQERFEKFQKEHPFNHAMGGQGHGEPRDHMAELSKTLKLTPDQQMQMKSIFSGFHPQIESIEGNKTMSKADKKAKLEDIHQRMHEKMRDILTPEQQQQFDQVHPD